MAEKKKETKKTVEAVKEEVKEAAEEEKALHPTLQKKKEAREAKAARKAANMVEEKKSRPNNILLAALIFGVLIAMFAVSFGYNYFQKPASIAEYIEDNGGAEVYDNIMIDNYTVAKVTAEGNSLTMDMTAEIDDEEAISYLKETYGGDEGKEYLEEIAASTLTGMKSGTRGSGGDVTVKMTLNKEELNTVTMTYSEAKKKIKELEKEAEEASDEAVEVETEEEHDHEHEDGSEEAAEETEESN